ncbi:unnamed protein product, partial [Symbiodinium sp. CCMP2456]
VVTGSTRPMELHVDVCIIWMGNDLVGTRGVFLAPNMPRWRETPENAGALGLWSDIETPAHKREIVLAGKEHAIKGAEEKREQLRSAAVAAARDRRYMEVLDSAMQAYQMGASETRRKTAGEPDVDLNQLVELLLLARATHVAGDHAAGLKYLDFLSKMVDNLTGADGNLPIFHPSSAATLLLCTAELFALFGQQERAADYSRAYIAMARLAHGEGSPPVGDAYGFHMALLARRGLLEEALHHAMMMLQVRQRCGTE